MGDSADEEGLHQTKPGEISCHNIVFETVHPSHRISTFELYKGQDTVGRVDDYPEIDLEYLHDYEKVLQLDQDLDD